MSNSKSYISIDLCSLLQMVLIILKITDKITCSWWIVFLPTLIPTAILIIVLIILLICFIIDRLVW